MASSASSGPISVIPSTSIVSPRSTSSSDGPAANSVEITLREREPAARALGVDRRRVAGDEPKGGDRNRMHAVATGELEDLGEFGLRHLAGQRPPSEQPRLQRAHEHVAVPDLSGALHARAGVVVCLLEAPVDVGLAEQRVIDPTEDSRARLRGDQGEEDRVQALHLRAVTGGDRVGEQLRRALSRGLPGRRARPRGRQSAVAIFRAAARARQRPAEARARPRPEISKRAEQPLGKLAALVPEVARDPQGTQAKGQCDADS